MQTFHSYLSDVVEADSDAARHQSEADQALEKDDLVIPYPHEKHHYFAMELPKLFNADVVMNFSAASGAVVKAMSVSRLMALVACLTLCAGAGPSTQADLIQPPMRTVTEKGRDSKSASINYMWVLFAGFVASCTCNCLILVHWCRKRKRSHQGTSKVDDMLVELYLQNLTVAELRGVAEAVGYPMDSSHITRRILVQMIMSRATQAQKENFKANGSLVASGSKQEHGE